MSPQDLLGKLPSLNELVDHPRVKRAIDQWNRSDALARVRTAVHDLSGEVARRAEDLGAKSPVELVEQLVERLQRPTLAPPSVVVNATGELWGSARQAVPMADSALDAACRSGGSYAVHGAATRAIAELLGAAEARVLSTPVAALSAVLEALGQQSGELIVAKTDAGDPLPQGPLATLAQAAGLEVVEVGGPGGATLEDYTRAIEASCAPRAVLVRRQEFLRVEGGVAGPTLAELASSVHQSGVTLIADLGGAPPVETPIDTGVDTVSAKGAFAAGADVVVLSGIGLVGGPACGLLAGPRALIEASDATHSGQIAAASNLTTAALVATLEMFAKPEQLRFAHPISRLIDTPLDNLRTRAERFAPQVADSSLVESAEAVALGAEQAAGPIGMVRLPSWGIAVSATDFPALEARFNTATPAITPRNALLDGRVVLDLRTVAPVEDATLLAVFAEEWPAEDA